MRRPPPRAVLLLTASLVLALGLFAALSVWLGADWSAAASWQPFGLFLEQEDRWTSIGPLFNRTASRWVEQVVQTPNPCPASMEHYFFCPPDPLPELAQQPPPSELGCPPFALTGPNPLVLIGVFSSAGGGQDERTKRDVWRLLGKAGIPWEYRHLIDVRFVLGRSSDAEQEARLDAEAAANGADLLRLDGLRSGGENMDEGKSYAFLRAVWLETRDEPDRRPVFVMKTDLDTLLVLPHVLTDLQAFAPTCRARSAAAYWGTHLGSWDKPGVPFYLRGLGYALSYPLLSFIASTPFPLAPEHVDHAEDVRTGHLIQSLPAGEPLWIKDEGALAQDRDSSVFVRGRLASSAVHKLKTPAETIEHAAAVRAAWEAAGVEYVWRPLSDRQIARGDLLVPL